MGMGYIVTSLADYFRIALPVAATLFVIGWIMLSFGLYALITTSRRAKAPLAI